MRVRKMMVSTANVTGYMGFSQLRTDQCPVSNINLRFSDRFTTDMIFESQSTFTLVTQSTWQTDETPKTTGKYSILEST